MLNVRPLAAVASWSVLLAAGCSQANFSGSNPSRATQTSLNPTQIACSLSADTVTLGGSVLVTVTSKGGEATLNQRVLAGGEAQSLELAKGETGYTLADGQENRVQATALGLQSIQIRRAESQDAADAVCDLNVIPAEGTGTGSGTDTATEPGTSTQTGTTTGTDTSIEPPTPPCQPTEQSIGAQLAFLIDNSNSNAATDCPSSKMIGTFNGVDVYECGEATNREKAVLAAFDLMRTIAEKEPGNALAMSRVAVASFPTAENYVDGWSVRSPFVDVSAASRQTVADALAFTRKPSGLTPYGAAMDAAKGIFADAAADKRAKVAVLVTDGEPTDRTPSAVAATAAKLQADGVQVITVFVTGGEQRAARIASHSKMMAGIDAATVQNTGNHWYDAAAYADFSAYMAALTGAGSEPGLAARISSLVDPACVDKPGALCARKIVEVQDSQALQNAFLRIIKTQAIGCES